jgi:preprotein translocase subunit SecG
MFALILLANFAIPRAGDNNVNLDNTLQGTAPIENTIPATNDSIN